MVKFSTSHSGSKVQIIIMNLEEEVIRIGKQLEKLVSQDPMVSAM